jgi:hypothetical protein
MKSLPPIPPRRKGEGKKRPEGMGLESGSADSLKRHISSFAKCAFSRYAPALGGKHRWPRVFIANVAFTPEDSGGSTLDLVFRRSRYRTHSKDTGV